MTRTMKQIREDSGMEHRGLACTTGMRRDQGTPSTRRTERKPLATLTRHRPQLWVKTPGAAPLRTPAPPLGGQRPPQERRRPRGRHLANGPPASRRQRHLPSRQQGALGTLMLGDKGPRTQLTIPRLCRVKNGQGGLLGTLAHCNPRPRKNLFIPVLPPARHGRTGTAVHRPQPQRQQTSWCQSWARRHRG